MTKTILALNAGSSSLKFALFSADQLRRIAQGVIRTDGREDSQVSVAGTADEILLQDAWPERGGGELVEHLFAWIGGTFRELDIAAVGHRIVHGGADFGDPVMIDDAALAKLEALTPLAPLHQPASLEPVRIIARLRPALPQVACFDTAFHQTIEPPASRYALPRAFEAEGIRRYGFHGLSYESIKAELAADARAQGKAPPARVIVGHLGSGASLCAMRDLKSVDTTMGFSTLDGLVMGSRAGSLDPGILLYLLKQKGFSPDRLEELLYRQSGLLGVSGISADVAALLASETPAAADALELFAFSVGRHTAALAAKLGGVDRFIFTGGIGEHSPETRGSIVKWLEWLGAELDAEANAAGGRRISTDGSRILIEWRPTQEELVIARHTWRACSQASERSQEFCS